MKIAIDESPIVNPDKKGHSVRGVGYYLKNLKKGLLGQFPKDDFIFFTEPKEIPGDTQIIHFPYFEPFFLSLPAVDNIPVVVTVHDLTPLIFPEHFPSGLKGRLKWQIQKRRLGKSKRIITDSEFSKSDIIRLTGIPDGMIDVVYLAASQNFKPIKDKKEINRVKKRYSLPDEFLLYVGDATWNKNLVRIVHAVQDTNLPLVLCGKAIKEKSYDNMNPWNQDLVTVQNIIENNNLFFPLGFVSDEDLPIIYSMARVFLMPSLYEGFGLPILEAMRCGLPVITSQEASIPEVAGEAAFFVDPYTAESIAKGIKRVWHDQKIRDDLRSKGYNQADKFSWEKTVQKTYESYNKAYNS